LRHRYWHMVGVLERESSDRDTVVVEMQQLRRIIRAIESNEYVGCDFT
jgi:hypothetical protein